MRNIRRTLAIKVQTPGGDNPLRMQLVGNGPFFRGIPVSGLALVGKGGTAPYAFSIIAGGDSSGGVNGLTLNTDGTFSGSGDASGRFVFVAEIADDAGSVFQHSFSITLLSQLFVVAGTPIPGEIGQSYSYQFVVRDAAGTTLTSGYSLESGNYPAGASLTSGGLLHAATLTVPDGVSYFTLSVTDGTDTIKIPCSVTVYPEVTLSFLEDRDPPHGWGGGAGSWLPPIIRGVEYMAHVVITGGLGPYTVNVNPSNPLPTGMKYDNGTRRITGTTMDAASASVPILIELSVRDVLGRSPPVTQRAILIIDAQQGRIIPQRNGSDVVGGDGATKFNFIEGANVTLDMTNDGDTLTIEIGADPGPGGGGIETINGVGPDSSGSLAIAGVGVDSNGDLFVEPTGGGISEAPNDASYYARHALGWSALGTAANQPTSAFDASGAAAAALVIAEAYADSGDALRVLKSANLSDVASAATSRSNLGLGSAALLSDPIGLTHGGHGQITALAGFNALSPITTKGDLITHDGTNSVRQAIGANDFVPIADSTQANGWRWGSKTIVNTFDPRLEFFFYDDFLYPIGTISAKDYWSNSTSGAATAAVSTVGRPGILRLSASSGVIAAFGGAVYVLGGGAVVVRFAYKLNTLSNGTNRFSMSCGLRDVFNGASSDGLSVLYTDNINSGRFVLRNVVGGVSTDTNTTVTVAINTWYDCVISIPAGGTSSTLTINGVLAATSATAVTAVAMSIGMNESITVGSAVGIFNDFDYIEIVGNK